MIKIYHGKMRANRGIQMTSERLRLRIRLRIRLPIRMF